jgi:hypothetical protein
MKIKEKMNPESIKSLKEFRQKQIQSNIKYHIAFLIMIVTVNLCLLYFIILYKNKISEINLKSDQRTSLIKQNQKNISQNQTSIDHKLVNLFANSMNMFGNAHFSLIFEKSEEVRMVKNFITDYTKIAEPYLYLAYQGNNDSDETRILLYLICHYPSLLMLIGTKDGNRFGYYYGDRIVPNKKGFFESNDDSCFIFSFQSKEKYNCLKAGEKLLEINKNSLFNIGNGDIIINYNFMTNGGMVNYPFKSFDIADDHNNTFTKENGDFEIQDIEIYAVYDANQ